MFATLFASLFVQGILLGLAALALLAAAPRLQKRYGPQWLCRLWVTLAVLLLVPLHALVPQAPAAVSVDTTPLYSRTALSQEVTERPADGVPYMAAPTGYIVPRAELQTGHRTVLERLTVGATRLNLLALAWNLGVLAVALYQFGGYAVWRIRVRRTAQPVDPGWRSALPQGACPRMVATPLVRSPMVAGTLHPVLLTPTGTAPNGADYMLAHELTHIKRHDVAKKLLFTLACAVHWYNPAVWLLAARAGRDIEEACDAETLCGRDADCRAAYADALLTLNVDFTPANDWNQQLLYLTYDEVNALDFSAPKTAALPGYTPPESLESDDPGVWNFTREGLYITAEWPGVERYTFYVHNGNASLKFDARTICVQGQSLS